MRAYGPEPLALGELSALLWAAAGVTARQQGFAFRTAPSAGGLYPIEHYVVANDVEGLERGLYHYDVLGRALERLVVADLRVPLAKAALGQRVCADAQAVFVWTAVLQRSRWKYGERFARYVLLDAGHIAENVALGGHRPRPGHLPDRRLLRRRGGSAPRGGPGRGAGRLHEHGRKAGRRVMSHSGRHSRR